MATRKGHIGKKGHIVLREFKAGTLRSGGSGRKVTSRKQALAIAFSEQKDADRRRRRR